MELYLTRYVAEQVYKYMDWDTLRHYDAPDEIWDIMRNYFCEDDEFNRKFEYYGGKAKLKARVLLLNLINIMLHPNGPTLFIPQPLLKDRAFVMLALKSKNILKNVAMKKDRSVILHAVKNGRFDNHDINIVWRQDAEIMMELIKCDGSMLKYMDHTLSGNRELVLEAVKSNGRALRYASDRWRDDRKIVIEAVKNDGRALEYVSTELKGDREVVMTSIKSNGVALNYANSVFRCDVEMITESIRQKRSCGFTLIDQHLAVVYVDEELKRNRQLISKWVNVNGLVLKYLDSRWRGDRDIVLEAVKQNGLALEYVMDGLKRDREIVLLALRTHGIALRYANDDCKMDRGIVLTAVKRNGMAMKYVDNVLREDKVIGLEAVRADARAFRFLGKGLRGDAEIVLEASKGKIRMYPASDEKKRKIFEDMKRRGYGDAGLIAERAMEFKIVSPNFMFLSDASDDIRNNKKIMTELVDRSPHGLHFASDGLKSDKDIVRIACERKSDTLIYAPKLRSDKDFVLSLRNGFRLSDTTLGYDKKVALAAIKYDTKLDIYLGLDPVLKGDTEIISKIIRHYAKTPEYVIPIF